MTNFLPLYIWAGLLLIGLGINIGTHGQPRKPNNAWISVISLIMEFGIWWWFLAVNHLL